MTLQSNRKSHVDEAQVDEEVLFNGGEEFNWHSHGLESIANLSTENVDFDEMKQWLPKVSEQALAAFTRQGNDCTLIDVNPRLVNKLQMLIVNYNLKHLLKFAHGNLDIGYENCKRLIIQGLCRYWQKARLLRFLLGLLGESSSVISQF